MKMTRFLLLAAIVLLGEAECFGQPVVWSGGGDGASWSDPNNWVGNQVPGSANNVFITNGLGANVVISSTVSVEGIICNKALTISSGSLTVTAGVSSLQGSFSISSGATVSASGNGTALTSSSTVIANGANLGVSGGAVLKLPGVTSYQGACGSVLQANGAGSVLALPGLTNLTQACGYGLTVEAENGGQVLLTNVAAVIGYISAQADGSNSVVNLSSLATNAGTPLYLEASGGGSVLLPKLVDGNQINLTLQAGGFISTTQLTNIDGSTLSAATGAILSLPGVASYSPGCGSSLEANGAGSVLTLPGLTNLNETCGYGLTIQAENGGKVLLHNLPTIDNGYVSFLADGVGSTIDLSSLSAFVLETGQGSLTAQNGGTILFNNTAFLLANVAISIPAGNPVLPPVLVASQTLTLYGIPWHSYRVEEWNALQPGSPVTTFLVPLTNSFQAFATAPQPNTAFLVTDFVANPSILQISLVSDADVQLVLYGLTNATYTVQSTTNLRPRVNWTPVTVAAMTNAFRIFPETPTLPPVQFFRAQQQ